MTRHYQVENDPLVAERAPLIAEAMPQIATTQIRNRGTFGGSIAHADPSAELVAISVALDGIYMLRSQTGTREFKGVDFFLGMFTTQLEPEELLVEVTIPALPARTGWALKEIARRPHDFALVGVAALVTLERARNNQQCSHGALQRWRWTRGCPQRGRNSARPATDTGSLPCCG